ncbi:MAG TPA: hypothetical protein VMV01_03465 [Planctomycetota bacterium]|nr:hypothetical protein [Planctomycetota bacterium]
MRTEALLAAALLAVGCASNPPPAPAPAPPSAEQPRAAAPPAAAEQAGEGPLPVYGASVYSPGQEIFKQLRQEDSLMAFLACQGEPDRVEVIESPGDQPRIVLEYTRSGLRQRGTVEIAPSPGGYYAAQPIDPSGRLSTARSEPPRRKAPPPKSSAPKAKPAATPRAEPAPEPEEPAAETAPEPAVPEPDPSQLDECPIEPWRSDCRSLCVPGASWEWCSYRD